MAAADLRRLMSLLGSSVTEQRFSELRMSGLLREVRSTVTEANDAVVSHGSIWGYNEPIRSACGDLVEVLEAVLRRHLAMEAWHQVPATFLANLPFRQAVARRLRVLLAEIMAEAIELMDLERTSDRAIPRFRLFRPTTPYPQPIRAMVGRQDAVEEMVSVLLRDDGGPPSLSVVPILGAPGIGKTRLAQALFSDARVAEHFDMLFWVYVSPHFNPIQILMKILQLFLQHGGGRGLEDGAGICSLLFDAEQFHAHLDQEEILQKLVHNALSGTRYLIVLDDVWNESISQWNILMHALPSDTKGMVMITTRIAAVASVMATIKPTTKPYFLQSLPDEFLPSFVDQWTHSFTQIGIDIAKKCDGLPLLLEYAGSSVHEMHFKISWRQYLEHFDILLGGDAVLESAFATFYHLPPAVQKCLLHCSVFPVDYNFHSEELASHLAAEGFIPCAMSKVQRGELLQKLLCECFYRVKDPAQKGNFIYRMHRIMHTFARRIDTQYMPLTRAGQIISREMPSVPIRYASLPVHPSTASFPNYLFEHTELRTLVLLQEENMCLSDQRCEINCIPEEFCRSLLNLRALSLHGVKIVMLPRNFELLSYLRYLNLSHTDIRAIPSTISKLHFLRTLILSHCRKLVKLHENTTHLVWLQEIDLEGCPYLVELPWNISNVNSLVYVNVCECLSLKQMPCRMGQLTNLKTLLGYVVSSNEGCTISELQALINLNVLSLEGLENISDLGEARDAQLQDKLKLESLTLRWNMHTEGTSSTVEEILESLQPNQGLKRLEIVAYEGEHLPSWITGSEPYLNALVEVRLINLKACKNLPPLGLLPFLKSVEISGAEAISCVDDNFYGTAGTFPSLKMLTFSYMTELNVWKKASYEVAFPHLAEVTIVQCPKLALDLELRAVKKLNLWMNNTMLYSSKGGLRGLAGSLKHVVISFSEDFVTSSDCEGLLDISGIKFLEIHGCHEMRCLPEVMQHFSSVRSLTINSCSKLEILPNWLENLSSLRLLHLCGLPILRSVPQVLTMRQGTTIYAQSCPNLSSGTSVQTQTKGKEIIKEEEDFQWFIDEHED